MPKSVSQKEEERKRDEEEERELPSFLSRSPKGGFGLQDLITFTEVKGKSVLKGDNLFWGGEEGGGVAIELTLQ